MTHQIPIKLISLWGQVHPLKAALRYVVYHESAAGDEAFTGQTLLLFDFCVNPSFSIMHSENQGGK